MLRETDFARQRDLMRQFERWVLDDAAHEIFLLWRYRIVPYRSYVKGWKIGPSHYVNQDLATIWLDKLRSLRRPIGSALYGQIRSRPAPGPMPTLSFLLKQHQRIT